MSDFAPARFHAFADGDSLSRAVARRYPVEEIDHCSAHEHRFPYMFVCTRQVGHAGPHVAHTDDGPAAAWWPNAASRDERRISEAREGVDL